MLSVFSDKNHIALVIDLNEALAVLTVMDKIAAVLGRVVAIGLVHYGKAKRHSFFNKILQKHLFAGEGTYVSGKAEQINIAEIPAYIMKFNITVELRVGRRGFLLYPTEFA